MPCRGIRNLVDNIPVIGKKLQSQENLDSEKQQCSTGDFSEIRSNFNPDWRLSKGSEETWEQRNKLKIIWTPTRKEPQGRWASKKKQAVPICEIKTGMENSLSASKTGNQKDDN